MDITKSQTMGLKKKKLQGRKLKTCAFYGILDCDCCHDTSLNNKNDKINKVPIFENKSKNLPSTSANSDKNISELSNLIIKSEFDDLPSAATEANRTILNNEEHKNNLEFNYNVTKITTNERDSASPEVEIDVVNDSPENLIEINEQTETAYNNETSVNIINDSIEEQHTCSKIAEEEIDVVSVEVNVTLDESASLPTNLNSGLPGCSKNPALLFEIVEENSLDAQNEEEIDVVNLYEGEQRNINTQKRPNNVTDMSVEEVDVYVDVVNEFNEDAPLSTLIMRTPIRKRLRSANTGVPAEVIEIHDSPKVISEIIIVDDDDDTSTNKKPSNLGHCPVCLEDLIRTEIMSTMCGHIFCAPCIKTVIKTNRKCPKCRKNLTLKSVHPLFF